MVSVNQFKTAQNVEKKIQSVKDKKLHMYEVNFRPFKKFCEENFLLVDFDSLEQYLHESITQQQVKLSTFNRRLAGIKYWLATKYAIQMTIEQQDRIKLLRQLYNNEQYLQLKSPRGARIKNQLDVFRLIDRYDTDNKADIRRRAICLVNLNTANRPSEMVRLKISDFDLKNHSVSVVMLKKNEIVEKRLTLECVQAVKKYMSVCDLQCDDFFVGAADKWGNHTSKQIHEDSYAQSIRKWLGFAPYMFRKTQITAMYNMGADIPTIAKQSGHKCHQTIMEHYIKLNTIDMDDFK